MKLNPKFYADCKFDTFGQKVGGKQNKSDPSTLTWALIQALFKYIDKSIQYPPFINLSTLYPRIKICQPRRRPIAKFGQIPLKAVGEIAQQKNFITNPSQAFIRGQGSFTPPFL